jgi:hypothetical protein
VLVSRSFPFGVSFRQCPPNVKALPHFRTSALPHFSSYYQGDPQQSARPEEVPRRWVLYRLSDDQKVTRVREPRAFLDIPRHPVPVIGQFFRRSFYRGRVMVLI